MIGPAATTKIASKAITEVKPASAKRPIEVGELQQFKDAMSDDPKVKTGSTNTASDAILEKVQDLKATYDQGVSEINDAVGKKDPLSVNEIMKVQLEIAKVMIQGEVVQKASSTVSNNVDLLLKSQ